MSPDPPRRGKPPTGFFGGLFDFGFERSSAVRIIKVMYALMFVMMGLSIGGLLLYLVITGGFLTTAFGGIAGGLLWLVFAPLLLLLVLTSVVAIASVRLHSELQMTVVQIADDIRRIADRQP